MGDLGLDSHVLRRDYLYGSLLSEGAEASEAPPLALLQRHSATKLSSYVVAHDFLKGGNVVNFNQDAATPVENSGEIFDVVVVGSGLSGLAAAHYIQQQMQGRAKVLILENHDFPGGNARRDEFVLGTSKLYAPQASTVIQDLPPALAPSDAAAALFQELGIDLQSRKVPENQYFFGVFRDGKDTGPAWYPNIFAAPLSDRTKQDMGAFFETVMHFYDADDWRDKLAELDKITFRDYLRSRNWSDELFRLMVPELGAFFGFPDAVSAACVYSHYGSKGPRYIYGFSGGNSGLVRHLLKNVIPSAIRGDSSPEAILNGAVDEEALDRPANPTRLRLRSSAVRVRHEGNPGGASHVSITIAAGNRRYLVQARGVVMACGGFVSRDVVADMPSDQREAYNSFVYAPVLWANVALNNSRALDKADLNFLSTYTDGFGGLLLRYEKMGAVMADPERPNVIGICCPRSYPGLTAREQEKRAQQEMMETPFRDYEERIRQDLVRVLGSWGFDPQHDIAAITIHRWAQHSYVFGYPGFFTSGVVDRARRRFGRIAFAHTDLHKFSLVMGAVEQGHRAALEIAGCLEERGAGAAD